MAETTFKVGYAEVDVTPPAGDRITGGFNERFAKGADDPLKSRVLYLDDGKTSVALVVSDVIGFVTPFARRVVKAAAEKAGEGGPRHVLLNATHTHTGPMMPRDGALPPDTAEIFPDIWPGKVNEKWLDSFVSKTVDAIVAARDEAKEEKSATLHLGHAPNVAKIRRLYMKNGTVTTLPPPDDRNIDRPTTDLDPRVHVLRFADTKTVVVMYGMHPVCLGMSYLKFSADYPRHLQAVMQHSLGKEWRVVFLNVACGNVAPSFTLDPDKEKRRGDNCKRMGEELAMAALEGLKKQIPFQPTPIVVERKEMTFKYRKPTPEDAAAAEKLVEEFRKTGKGKLVEFNGLHANAAYVLAKTKHTDTESEVSAMRFGSMGFAFLPGEVFVETARSIENGSPLRPTLTVGLTNGMVGYLPTYRAFAEGGYETGYRAAKLGPEAGQALSEEAMKMLRRMAT